ncbi:MAG: hypothetical protein Ta2G_14990 [Termitinemataceae bacterium]|nr:MAG: hypothetical protein Ta2G_14990 [Termitinemataceae bacterium]
MVVASIDVQNGKVVQLKQGAELVIERTDADDLINDFNRFGEVAVIDLDAAMGKQNNDALILPLLRKAQCRVGGGIRSAERALQLVSLGAKKVIVGSQAFRFEGGFALNVPFLQELAAKIGRNRIIIAVDAISGEIVVDGWKTKTGLNLLQTASDAEKYAGELLFTCVEKEGMLGGTDMEAVRNLRQAVKCRLTVAGGVSTLEEIEALAKLDCDVQLGMALYTGRLNLTDAFIASLNWAKAFLGGDSRYLLPVIAQSPDGQVLMTGYADKEAVEMSFKRGFLCFHSRSRNKLWQKGETSHNTLRLIKMRADCDRDALLATVENVGEICHTGAWSCFENDRRWTFEQLLSLINERFASAPAGSYTASLTADKVRKKLMEESFEVCTAKTHDEIVFESADVFYFLLALMARENISVQEVLDELQRRHFDRSHKSRE